MRRRSWLVAIALTVSVPQLFADDHRDERHALRVPSQFATIQSAVDAAQPGDTIVVSPGTFCENVTISKSDVRLRARDADEGRRPSVGGTECALNGTGILVTGTAASPVANVEIRGFVVDGFELGIKLLNVVGSRVVGNEVRNNKRDNVARSVAGGHNGILLIGSSFNEISRNFVHDNGHMGIGVSAGSNANIVRGNSLIDNQATYTSSCSLMVFVNSVGNQIIENEVVDTSGAGIMLGGGSVTVPQASATVVAGNRVSDHPGAGIVLNPMSPSNLILRNDATGNGTGGNEPDLLDMNTPSTNLWIQNGGTCNAGNAGC